MNRKDRRELLKDATNIRLKETGGLSLSEELCDFVEQCISEIAKSPTEKRYIINMFYEGIRWRESMGCIQDLECIRQNYRLEVENER